MTELHDKVRIIERVEFIEMSSNIILCDVRGMKHTRMLVIQFSVAHLLIYICKQRSIGTL